MICPKCGTKDFKILKVSKINDTTNSSGRRQLNFTVEYKENIKYDTKTLSYLCKKCGTNISYQEITSKIFKPKTLREIFV
jgi:hypothetical protein